MPARTRTAAEASAPELTMRDGGKVSGRIAPIGVGFSARDTGFHGTALASGSSERVVVCDTTTWGTIED